MDKESYIESVEHVGKHEWSVKIKCCNGSPQLRVLSYYALRNGWTLTGTPGRLSISSVAKITNKPENYWEGFCDSLLFVSSCMRNAMSLAKEMRAERRVFSRKLKAGIAEERLECVRKLALIKYSQQKSSYPNVPPPLVVAEQAELPNDSGIYFVWRGYDVVYVGQSKHLKNRVNLQHGHIRRGDWVSWVLLPWSELDYAEAFYIGTLRPRLNFGAKQPEN